MSHCTEIYVVAQTTYHLNASLCNAAPTIMFVFLRNLISAYI